MPQFQQSVGTFHVLDFVEHVILKSVANGIVENDDIRQEQMVVQCVDLGLKRFCLSIECFSLLITVSFFWLIAFCVNFFNICY